MTVVLCGKDLIVNTEAVGAYLARAENGSREAGNWRERVWKGDGLNLLWFQNLDHGQVFDKKITRDELVSVVRRYCNGTSK